MYLEMENDILERFMEVEKELRRKVALPTIERLREKYTVTMILAVLAIPRATYYRWVKEGVKKP